MATVNPIGPTPNVRVYAGGVSSTAISPKDGSSKEGLLSAAHRRVSIAIYTTIALIAFEGTSVAAALPELAADLGDLSLLPWVITGFLFALGISTIVAGPLVDALGSRQLFVWSAAVFAGTGFLAGLSTSLTMMIVIRLVQGGASGVLFAATIAAVNLAFPSHLTGRAFAANSTVWGLMGALAPAIAAAMLNIASWRWIFFINLPLGLVALVAGHRVLPGRQAGAEPVSIDWRGTLLAAVFTLATIAAVERLGVLSAVYLVVAVGAVLVYGWHARRAERPVVSLSHIAVEPYRSLALLPALMLGSAFTTNIYITVYVAAGRGFSSGTAAWSVLFFTIGWTVGANVSSVVLDRRSTVWVMTAGLASGSAGSATIALAVVTNGPLPIVFAGLVALGIGIGLTTNAGLIMLRQVTESSQIGRAGAANQFMRSQGFTLGAAAGGAILLFVVDRRLGSVEPVRRLLAGDDVDPDPAVAAAVRSGFGAVTITALVVMLLAAIPMAGLRRHAARTDDVETVGVPAPS